MMEEAWVATLIQSGSPAEEEPRLIFREAAEAAETAPANNSRMNDFFMVLANSQDICRIWNPVWMLQP